MDIVAIPFFALMRAITPSGNRVGTDLSNYAGNRLASLWIRLAGFHRAQTRNEDPHIDGAFFSQERQDCLADDFVCQLIFFTSVHKCVSECRMFRATHGYNIFPVASCH